MHPQIGFIKHNREPKQFNTSLANKGTFTLLFLPDFSLHFTLAELRGVLSISDSREKVSATKK